MPPKSVELGETWTEWYEGWKLWTQQVGMNLWYGRGGLNVKVCLLVSRLSLKQDFGQSAKVCVNVSTSIFWQVMEKPTNFSRLAVLSVFIEESSEIRFSHRQQCGFSN